MDILLALPIIIPLSTAAAVLLARKHATARRALALAGAVALLAVAATLLAEVWLDGIRATQIGGWPAPFGITLVADLFSAVMVCLAALSGVVVVFYSFSSIDEGREEFGYYSLLHLLLMGVCGAFLTGDIFNLFVWFEVSLLSSFVLLALGGERPQIEGAIKYVTLNLFSSTLFLTGLGILYGMAGSLNMADLAGRLDRVAQPGLVTTLAMLFLVAFGIKAAIFPLYSWLPASYHTPPITVSAIFAGLLTKVGVYALVRVFTLLFTQDVLYTHSIILVLAALTMLSGALGAVAQTDFRRVLSFNIISQIGLVVMGLGLYTTLSLAGLIFLVIEDVIVLTCLFLIAGAVHRVKGSYQLSELGGVLKSSPLLSVLFLLSALSLGGIPPLPGFFAKLALIKAALETQQYLVAATALVTSLLTLFVMTRLWSEIFWKTAPGGESAASPVRRGRRAMLYAPIGVLTGLTVALGLGAGPVLAFSLTAARQLRYPTEYLEAVLQRPARGAATQPLLTVEHAAGDETRIPHEVRTP